MLSHLQPRGMLCFASRSIPFSTFHAYANQNIELFFCLYSCQWRDAAKCTSSHSRALGFLQTVPAIIRGLQCLRRFYDTRSAWPHLANLGKYSFTIFYYAFLSAYRIDQSSTMKAIFITFATVNALYCCMFPCTLQQQAIHRGLYLLTKLFHVVLWDTLMDWSMGLFFPVCMIQH